VEQLLLLFHKFSNLVQEAFNDDPRFLTARDKAYKQVVNDTTVFRLELPTKQVSYLILFASDSYPGELQPSWWFANTILAMNV